MFQPDENWLTLFAELGIERSLIIPLSIDSAYYKEIYLRLKCHLKYAGQTTLKIEEAWQIYALTGDPSCYLGISKEAVDNCGARLAHYAAWSGSRKALDWVLENVPKLLTAKDKEEHTIAHYAIRYDNKDVLDWILINKPELFNKSTAAHFAAEFGKIQSLDWMRANIPQILTDKADRNTTIAHYAARRGNKESLSWVLKHVPIVLTAHSGYPDCTILHIVARFGSLELLDWIFTNVPNIITEEDKFRQHNLERLACDAARSGCPAVLERVLAHFPEVLLVKYGGEKYDISFTGAPIIFHAIRSRSVKQLNYVLSLPPINNNFAKYYSLSYDREGQKMVSLALNTNYKITSVGSLEKVHTSLKNDIESKLLRNQSILNTIVSISAVIRGFYQKNSPISLLPIEMLLIIVKNTLPNCMSEKCVLDILNYLLKKMIPKTRIETLIDLELDRLQKVQNSGNTVLIENKIYAFKTLCEIVVNAPLDFSGCFKEQLKTWYIQHCDIIKAREGNLIKQFFSLMQESPTYTKCLQIFKILEYHENDFFLANADQIEQVKSPYKLKRD